jgi:nucleoside phosphorylase
MSMPELNTEVRVGLVAALPVEAAALRLVIDDVRAQSLPDDPNRYHIGTLPSTTPGHAHRVVAALQAYDGTRSAAAICTDLARSFPQLRIVIMCGIAGGVPAPDHPDRDIWLGDIVSATDGVVDYDHVRSADGVEDIRRPVSGVSVELLRAEREVEARQQLGHEPWLDVLRRPDLPARFRRPPASTDTLLHRGTVVPHADPSGRVGPRVHRGLIGSADRLLRDPELRDRLAARHRIRAIEMEGSGIGVGTVLHGLSWYVVRGVADYCDGAKSDLWHGYAALAAAAYTRAILGHLPPAQSPPQGATNGLYGIVEQLATLRAMRDEQQRLLLVNALPPHIGAQVPYHSAARIHAISIVQTCERYADGEQALIKALRLILGDTPEWRRLVATIRDGWTGAAAGT